MPRARFLQPWFARADDTDTSEFGYPCGLWQTMLGVDIMMKSNYKVTKYADPNTSNTFSTNTMGIRINIEDHMSFCRP